MASKKVDLLNAKNLLGNVADKIDRIEDKDKFNFRMIDINLIVPNENNFFKITDEDIEELAKDIKENDIYHNLVVSPIENGKFKLISGERRLRAAKSIGYTKVPCQIRNVDPLTSDEMLIQANWSARELTEYEKMTCVQKLNEIMEQKKKNGENIRGKRKDLIGESLNMSGTQAQRYITIAKKLIPELKELFSKQEITLIDSFDFSQLNEKQQKGIYEFLKNNEKVSKEEIYNLKKQISRKEEEKSIIEQEKKSLEIEKESLSKKIMSLEDNLSLKNNELENTNKSIENIKKKIEEDISKKVEAKNEKEKKNLQAQLKSLESQKKSIENELKEIENQKNKEIEALNSNKEKIINANNNIKSNVKLEIVMKSLNNSINDILNLSDNIDSISDENKANLKQLKSNLNRISELIDKI